MAKQYLEELSALMKRVAPRKLKNDLECKHFFSGAAVYARGRICMSLTPGGFAIKVPESSRHTLMKHRGAKPLRYFPQGPIKKDYVVLPTGVLVDTKALRAWVKISIEYVTSSPRPAVRRGQR